MVESSFWRYLYVGMRTFWSADRIETGSTTMGVPDVFFSMPGRMGWIELKLVKSLPARDSSKVSMKISPLQVHWLKSRHAHFGNTWLFICLQTPKTFYLIEGKNVQKHFLKSELEPLSRKIWRTKIDFRELALILQDGTFPVPESNH
jgi:hypothetical protein